MTNLSMLPSIGDAKLPATYSAAKVAIGKCVHMDECKDWADKSEALASYAKQAKDDELRRMADRIQARAIRRCGELLREIEPAKGKRTDLQPTEGDHSKSRKDAAKEAGLSEHQQNTALRVANVPAEQFEEAVESEEPPTVTELAKAGTKPAPRSVVVEMKPAQSLLDHGRDPRDFSLSTEGQGALARFVEMTTKVSPEVMIRGAMDHEIKSIVYNAGLSVEWLTRLAKLILKEKSNEYLSV